MSVHADLPRWRYFLLLERDLEECYRFVAPLPEHFSVHSDRFAQIILLACTEVENALAAIASHLEPDRQVGGIGALQRIVCTKFPFLVRSNVVLPQYSLELRPWEHWSAESPPDWWTNGYNKIKHDRLSHFAAPTLYRATASVAGLLVVLLHLYSCMHGERCSLPMRLAPAVMDLAPQGGLVDQSGIFWYWDLPLSRDA